jgi:hypothetical protein
MMDELDDILKSRDVPLMEAVGQEALVQRSMKQLHRQRHFRQAVRGLGVVLLLGAGIALGFMLSPKPNDMALSTVQATEPEVPPLLSAAQLELEAEKALMASSASQYYRQAGDRFLEAQDIRSALRCYRLHLTEGGPVARSVTTHDSWLLLSIKTNSTGD